MSRSQLYTEADVQSAMALFKMWVRQSAVGTVSSRFYWRGELRFDPRGRSGADRVSGGFSFHVEQITVDSPRLTSRE